MSQIDAETQAWADAQTITTSCAIAGCRWKFRGTAAEGRVEAVEHREKDHPELRPRSRQAIVTEQRKKEKKVAEEKQRIAREARRPAPARPSAPAPRRKWSEDQALAAVREVAADLGHPPSANEAKKDKRLPAGPTVTRLFGCHAEMIERAGFPRPHRGTRYAPQSPSPVAEATGDGVPEPEPEPPETPQEEALDGISPPISDRVAAFLYLLLLDRLPAGELEDLLRAADGLRRAGKFPNGGLETYARGLGDRLLESAA